MSFSAASTKTILVPVQWKLGSSVTHAVPADTRVNIAPRNVTLR